MELLPVDHLLGAIGHCWLCGQGFAGDEFYGLVGEWCTCIGCLCQLACDSENPPLGQ